jgi:hypothetical protein
MQLSAPTTEFKNDHSPSNSFPTRVVTEGNRMIHVVWEFEVGGCQSFVVCFKVTRVVVSNVSFQDCFFLLLLASSS